MSYLVLARKSRPQTFDEVVGQRPVVKTLQNSLTRDRVAHAILFSGVRGVGKTTLARIMAKALNCENGLARNPCNKCSSCLQIMAGSSLDLNEIDGASNRGIQEIRELKEKIRFLPTSSKFKIIIIDEVHMLTTEAFNALLKTLEEPPAHVYFIFATTELHKIPITILSRCQRYELKRVSSKDLADHFSKLSKKEGITLASGALDLIVRESEGSVRDGLSLLDQVFSFGEKEISTDDVIEVLGLVDRDVILTISRALLERDPAKALQALAGTFSYGMDFKRFTTDLLDCFRTLLLTKIKGCDTLLDLPEQEMAQIKNLAQDYSSQTLHMKLNLLMQGIEEIRYSSQPRLALETCFLNIIQADDVVEISTLLGKFAELLAADDDGDSDNNKKPQTSVQVTPAPETTRTKTKVAVDVDIDVEEKKKNIEEVKSPERIAGKEDTGSEPATVSKPDVSDSKPEKEPVQKEPQQTTPSPQANQRDIRRDWRAFINYVKDRSIWMAQDLSRADQAKEESQELLLHYSDPNNCTLLRKKENKKLLTEYTLDFFQKELKIRFILPDLTADNDSENGDSPQKQRQQLANDPLVHMAVEIFNGQVGDIRIGPRFR